MKTYLFKIVLYASFIFVCAFLLDAGIIKVYEFILDPVGVDTIPVSIVVPHNPKVEEEKPLSVKEQIIAIAETEGFRWPDYLIRLAACESRLDPNAVNINSNGSKDCGIFQINDVHGISEDLRFDVEWATKWTINKINEGSQGIWVCDSKVRSNPQKYEQIARGL